MREFSKKIIIFATSAVLAVLLSAFLGFNLLKGDRAVLSERPVPEQLKITKTDSSAYFFKTLSNDLIEIGSQKITDQPYLKLNKWDGEVSLEINFPEIAGTKPSFDGQKLTYSATGNEKMAWWQKLLPDFFASADAQQTNKSKMDIAFYPRQPEQISEKDSNGNTNTLITNEDGGVEFDTILYEKPETNAISYPIETQNLDFFYQPPLNEENQDTNLTCMETECKDKDGNIVNYRPENVVGSYAVYYKDGKSGDYSAMGGQNYKTGKAFHIYRPKVTDAAGKEVWGELNVDTATNNLTVTVPQEFLDGASYPVKIDPMFGYDGVGATASTASSPVCISSTPSESGIVDEISQYVHYNSAPTELGSAIYVGSGSNPTTKLAEDSGNATISRASPYRYDVPVSASITGGIKYWLCTWSSGMDWVSFDSGTVEGYTSMGSPTFETWPSPFGTGFSSTLKFSIYATYSATGSNCGDHSLSGWAWSENTGWTSFSCKDTLASQNYGVDINFSSGLLSGQAWSENIGWVSFDQADLTGCPSGACEARLSVSTYAFSGWARALAAPSSASGWDGWIKLNGTTSDATPYGVFLNNSTRELYGWAWGGNTANADSAGTIGWVSFNCSNLYSCSNIVYNVRLAASTPSVSNLTAPSDSSDNYCKCWLDASVPPQKQTGRNGSVNFSWLYQDVSGSPLKSYQLKVSETNDLANGVTTTYQNWSGLNIVSGSQVDSAQVNVTSTFVSNEMLYNKTYYWWINACNAGDVCTGWINGPSFSTPEKHYPIVGITRASEKIIANEDTQFCTTADVNDPADPCYAACYKGSASPAVPGDPNNAGTEWVCSTCFSDSANQYKACQDVPGTAYNWYFGTDDANYVEGTDYVFVSSTDATSPNPVVKFLRSVKGTKIKLNVSGSSCGAGTSTDILLPNPVWKEKSPF